MNKIITLVMLMSTVITTHSAAPDPAIFSFKIGKLNTYDLYDEEILWLNLERREENTDKAFRKLQQKASERKLPWLLAILRLSGPTPQGTKYVDITELMRGPHYKQAFDCHTSTKAAVDLAIESFLKNHYPSYRITRRTYTTLYPSKKNKMPTIRSLYYIIKDDAGSIVEEVSDLSCALAIALCNDYSQLEMIAKSAYEVAVNTKEQEDVHQAKFWLKRLVEEEPYDGDAIQKLERLYAPHSKYKRVKSSLS